MPHDPESMAGARDAFTQWAAKTGDALVEPGAPIGSTRTVSSSGTQDGPAAGPVNGWSVLEAANAEEAAQKLTDHPFIARGGVLQISEPATG
ncbi:MAG: hypothetical protein ACLQFR_04760 [Streptosporangiaceae bacterium]